jgi:hypothetical protein
MFPLLAGVGAALFVAAGTKYIMDKRKDPGPLEPPPEGADIAKKLSEGGTDGA